MTASAPGDLSEPIVRVEARVLNVSPKTNWFFVRVQTEAGRIGWGEASLNGWERVLQACLEMRAPALLGQRCEQALAGLLVSESVGGGLAANAIVSALAQALCDVLAQQAGLPLSRWLSGHRQVVRGPVEHGLELVGQDKEGPAGLSRRSATVSAVMTYANINRATVDRSPKGVATQARRAHDQGFRAFKLAPFDGLSPALCGSAEGQRLVDAGLERLTAMRDAVGPDARVMADCHWRFSTEAALAVLPRLDALRLYWFECPITESVDGWADGRRIRRAARERGVLIAAAESQVGLRAFERLFENELYDVVMPDVKYCGGPLELLAIAAAAAAAGVQCSPHNPTGPICTLHSLHLSAAAACPMLELQVNESPLTDELLGYAHPLLVDGALQVPTSPGLGVCVDEGCFDRHPYQPVPVGLL